MNWGVGSGVMAELGSGEVGRKKLPPQTNKVIKPK